MRLDALWMGGQLGTLMGLHASKAYSVGSKRFKLVLLPGARRGVAIGETGVRKRRKSIKIVLRPFILPLYIALLL